MDFPRAERGKYLYQQHIRKTNKMKTLLPLTVKLYGSHVTAVCRPLSVAKPPHKRVESTVKRWKKRIFKNWELPKVDEVLHCAISAA